MAEAVTHGQTGLLCKRNDVAAFAAAVRDLADDPLRRAAMAQAARREAVARFSESAMLDAYVQLYAHIQFQFIRRGAT